MRSSLLSWLFLMGIYSHFFSFSVYAASGQCLGDQQNLLLQLKNNLTFRSYSSTKLVTWNQTVDCCAWGGVTCRDGHVIGLDLANESISSGLDKSSSLFGLLNLDFLDLSSNLMDGNIPLSLFSLQFITLNLSNNQFSSRVNEFSNISFDLEELDLSHNNLKVPKPMSIFEIKGYLSSLLLSSNNFFGSLELRLDFLGLLDLSHNHLSEVEISASNHSELPFLQIIILPSNNLKKIPKFLSSQIDLSYLDLSNNQIDGEMPNWIGNLLSLEHLDLSYNFLVTLEDLFVGIQLATLDLSYNRLQGLPEKMGGTQCYANPSLEMQGVCYPRVIDLSSNMFRGSIPESICNILNLKVLDLSNNSFSGTIPQCLLGLNDSLGVLNLNGNNLSGIISNVFPNNCELQALILNGNQIEGKLPKSLANCKELEVLDFGNNNIKGTFPLYLEKAWNLKILILRSNKFYGLIPHLGDNTSWPMLQIVDIAVNNFSGRFPKISFSTWKAMTNEALVKSEPHYLQYNHELQNEKDEMISHNLVDAHYQLVVTFDSKGLMRMIKKIFAIYTVVDFSCNNFNGPIPREIGELKLLFVLNLSHNAFIGQIPPALGKLSNLESLDLSSNDLSGKIPVQLADGLIFLSALNLSFNQLEGQVPTIKQFATFENSSFEGNKELCGFPLSLQCINEKPTLEETHLNSKTMIQPSYIIVELGFIFGLGIVIWPLMFWKKWRVRYYQCVDSILFRIFPQLYMGRNYHWRGMH